MGQFIKFFSSNSCRSGHFPVEDYLAAAPASSQLRYAFSQALAVSYFAWLHGLANNPLVAKYAEWLKTFIYNLEANNYEGIYLTLYNYLKVVPDSWYGGRWIDLPIKEVKILLIDTADQDSIPCLSEEQLIPYLMYRNSAVQEGFEVYTKHISIPKFRVEYRGTVDIGSLYIHSHNFCACPFEAVDKREELVGAFKKLPGILQFLIRCRMNNNASFEAIFGLLATLCLDMDPYKQVGANNMLFYDSFVVLNDMIRVDIASIGCCSSKICHYNGSIKPNEFDHDTRQTLMEFIKIKNLTDGTIFNSKEFFVRYFGAFTNLSKAEMDVIKYVKNYGTNVATGNEARAYKASPLGSCEAINLISHQEGGQIPSAVTTETKPNNEESEDDLLVEDIPDLDVAEPSMEAEGEDQPPDDDGDTSTDSDTGSDDSSSNEESSSNEDTQDSEDGDTNKGDEESGDSNSSSPEESEGVQTEGETEDINTSDDEGIVIEFSGEGGDSVDTVLFREELDQFISDTLVNPPKKLSPQSVAALTTLQKCWVHILTVETVVRILGRIVALPDKFNQILKNQESK